ncbi:hypothetical protein [Micromonospora sp. DT229]|uniref:hypothetical protein n=1 Tax=Micromonospora sp. DT229 TaxID=3393430 RepID=UPI003CF5D30F
MEVRVAAVHPGTPTMVEAVLAGVRLKAEWVGQPAQPGEIVDVELDSDDMLEWGDAIAMADAESTLHEGPPTARNRRRPRATTPDHTDHRRTVAGRAQQRPSQHPARHGCCRRC